MDFIKLASSENETEWHADRSLGVTASELGILEHQGAAAWIRLKAEKSETAPRWGGNKYTAWGHEREPFIMSFLARKYGIEPNSHLLQSPTEPQRLGTPDGIGRFNTLGEAKASLADYWDEVPKEHGTQAQGNMLVTGANLVILAVEYFDERPDGSLIVRDFGDPQVWLIRRDEEHIERLRGIGDRFLDMGEPTEEDELLARAVEAKAKIAEANEEWKNLEAEIFAALGTDKRFNHPHPELGSFSYTPPAPRKQFLKEKFEESYPDLAEQFTVEGRVPKPSIRVTPLKEAK